MWSTRSLQMPSTWIMVTKKFMESHGLWAMLLSTIAMAQPHPATTTTSAPLAAWRPPPHQLHRGPALQGHGQKQGSSNTVTYTSNKSTGKERSCIHTIAYNWVMKSIKAISVIINVVGKRVGIPRLAEVSSRNPELIHTPKSVFHLV